MLLFLLWTMSSYQRGNCCPWTWVKKLICCLISKLHSPVSGPDPAWAVVNFNHRRQSLLRVPWLSIPELNLWQLSLPALSALTALSQKLIANFVCWIILEHMFWGHQHTEIFITVCAICYTITLRTVYMSINSSKQEWQRKRWSDLQIVTL